MVYSWAASPVSLDEVELSQYRLTTWDHGVRTENSSRKIASGMRRDSVAFLTFDFEREMGFYILGIYFPLNLVVGCSWVAFGSSRLTSPPASPWASPQSSPSLK